MLMAVVSACSGDLETPEQRLMEIDRELSSITASPTSDCVDIQLLCEDAVAVCAETQSARCESLLSRCDKELSKRCGDLSADSGTEEDAIVAAGDAATVDPLWRSSGTTWQNAAQSAVDGKFEATFNLHALTSNMDGVVGFGSGPASTFDDLAVIVRLNVNGQIDVRDGTSYRADASVSYKSGDTFIVRITGDVQTKRYSVAVETPANDTVVVADNYSFRSAQLTVAQLNNAAIWAGSGEFGIDGLELAPLTTEEVLRSNGTLWSNTNQVAVGGKFKAVFKMRALNSTMDGLMGLSPAAAATFDDLAAIVRFNHSGQLDVRDGASYRADATVTYQVGDTFNISIDGARPTRTGACDKGFKSVRR